MGPDDFDVGAIGQHLLRFYSRIRLGAGALNEKNRVLDTIHDLPFQDTALFKPLGSVLADQVPISQYKSPNRIE